MENNNKELIQRLKDESQKHQAFRDLLSLYKKRLYWHIRRMVICHEDADDVLQNTFIKVWNAIDTFREESNLYTWLYRIATNESLSFLEQKKRKWFSGDDGELTDSLVQNLQSDSFFDGDEVQLKLQKAIAKLPAKQRLVFNMKYFEDMKYQEMAQILETSEGALKASYHHATKKITEYMQNNNIVD